MAQAFMVKKKRQKTMEQRRKGVRALTWIHSGSRSYYVTHYVPETNEMFDISFNFDEETAHVDVHKYGEKESDEKLVKKIRENLGKEIMNFEYDYTDEFFETIIDYNKLKKAAKLREKYLEILKELDRLGSEIFWDSGILEEHRGKMQRITIPRKTRYTWL